MGKKNKIAPSDNAWVSAVPGAQNDSKRKEGNNFAKDFDIKIKEFYQKHRRTIQLLMYCAYLAIISLTVMQAHGSGDSTYISTLSVHKMLARGHNLINYTTWPVSPNHPRSYLDVGNFADFFDWLPTLPMFLLPQRYYNGDPLEEIKIDYTFKLLGNITLRQVRVSPSSCTPLHSFQELINSSECFGELGFSGDARDTFVTAGGNSYIWRDSDLLKTGRYFGQYDSYPGGGYLVVLPSDADEFAVAATELLNTRFLDLGTRVVFVSLLLYNPSNRLIVDIKVVFESPASGGCIPYLDIKSARYSDLFFSSDTSSELGLQVMLLIFTLFYLLSGLHAWYQLGGRVYWSAQGDHSWVYFEWAKHACVIAGFVFKFWAYSFTQYAGMFPPPKGQTTNLEIAMQYILFWKVFLSFGIMAAWIQMLQFMGHFSSVKLFVRTCVLCLPAVIPFMVTYLILTAGAAFAFCLTFSDTSFTAKSFPFSFMFTFIAFVSGYDFMELYQANRVMGPLLHIFWFFVSSIMANNFIVALIMSKMEEQQDLIGPSVSMIDHIKTLYERIVPPAPSLSEVENCAAVQIQSVVRGHFGRQLVAQAAEAVLEDEQAAATYSRAKKAESRSRLLAIGSDLERIKAMSDAKSIKQLTASIEEALARVQAAGAAAASIDAGKHALITQMAQLHQVFDKLALIAEGAVVSSQRKIINE